MTECEACFTPDVCQLRGKCDHYSAEWLRVAAPPPPAPQPEAPSGWRMVPVEPTKAMLAAGDKIMDCDPLWVARGYRAMIEAAPPPAAPTPEPSDAVAEFARGIDAAARFVEKRLADYDAAHGSTDSDTGAREYPGTGDEYVCELAEIAEAIRGLAPPPSAPEPSEAEIEAEIEAACAVYDALGPTTDRGLMADALRAAAAARKA